MNCFKFKIGNKTYEKAADYTDAYIVVNANTVNNGNVVFVNSVDIYKSTESSAYIKYTINV